MDHDVVPDIVRYNNALSQYWSLWCAMSTLDETLWDGTQVPLPHTLDALIAQNPQIFHVDIMGTEVARMLVTERLYRSLMPLALQAFGIVTATFDHFRSQSAL